MGRFEGVTHVVRLSSAIGQGCKLCAVAIGFDDTGLANEINHYITEHGDRLLHLGQETSRDDQGKPWAIDGGISWEVARLSFAVDPFA